MRQEKNIDADFDTRSTQVLREALMGLSQTPKTLPPKLLYDEKGSEIFEKICELKEYYPTKAETEILSKYGSAIGHLIGQDALIIEPGSGNCEKIRHLLKGLIRPQGYVPIEICAEMLQRSTEQLRIDYPELNTIPVCADFSGQFDLPLTVRSYRRKKIIFFPGSTIGNLTPSEALQFLKKCGGVIKSGGGLLIGVDLKKNQEILKKAYDDPQGVTAAFNLNLLSRLNREAAASFDIEKFEHEAFYNEEEGRVEMHLKSKASQLVQVHESVFLFQEGETIHTENSYKYSVEEFVELCQKAKLKLRQHWKDSRGLFCVFYFEKE